jgi:cytochrome c
MHAKRLQFNGRFCLVIFRCVLAILLSSAATMAYAQSSVSASPRREGASSNAAREGSRTAAAINAGRILFNQRCEICHFVDSDAQKIGPGLKGLFARARFADGTRVTEASVAKIIGEGGKDMPDYKTLLKPAQLQALIAYLKSR